MAPQKAAEPTKAAGRSRVDYKALYGNFQRKPPHQLVTARRPSQCTVSRVRRKCVVFVGLLIAVLAWKGTRWYVATAEVPPADTPLSKESGHARDDEVAMRTPRRLDPHDHTDADKGPDHGYDCLNADEAHDVKSIKLKLVRKYHVTMGGVGESSCAAGEGPCLKELWILIIYVPAMFYMFIALALVCDEFFVPSLERIVDHYGISMDVAGATFMAAGGSMPELFTSLLSVFDESEVGFAAIVGSAVFNVLFVIAVCALAADEPLQLSGWPLARDCTFYLLALSLIVFFLVGSSKEEIDAWEAAILFMWYILYCLFMKFNEPLKNYVDKKFGKQADEDAEPTKDIKRPSTFRTGIIQLLTKHASIKDTAGILMITQLKKNLQESFNEMDDDGDGCIDKVEFEKFMTKLLHTNDDAEKVEADRMYIEQAWAAMPKNDDCKIAFKQFSQWYTVSEFRVDVEVRRVFDQLDQNGDRTIDSNEVTSLLKSIGHRLGPQESAEVTADLMRVAMKDPENDDVSKIRIDYEQFEKWYRNSMLWNDHHKQHEMEKKAEEGFHIDWPEDGATCSQLFWYILTYPLCAAMYCSLPDVRRPGMDEKSIAWAFIEFALSLVWIGIFTAMLYECTVVCSNTVGIPPPVSGVTLLAAGTSVPDLLSSYIVARQGEGDMAVSSSIGSNIFDVTVGLPVPWMIYSFYSGKPVDVSSQGLAWSILVLIMMLGGVIVTVMAMKWRMTKAMGGIMLALYVIYIIQYLLQQFPRPPKKPAVTINLR